MTAETSNAREWVSLLERAVPFLHDEAAKYDDDGSNEPLELAREIETLLASLPSDESALSPASLAFDGGREAAPPPAAARGDVRGLVALAERVQYADTHAQVSKDDAGEFVCLPPWLWLEIRDAAAEALAAEGVQAGEVEQRARELLRHQYIKRGYSDGNAEVRIGYIERHEPGAFSAIASALSQQPEPKAEARELLDARVIDSLINANEEIHAAAEELASCLAGAVAAGATDIPLTHRAGMALRKYDSLTELAPKAEARGVVDEAVPRYVCLKAEGSRYAYVNDTQESRTVKRYDIFRRYGGVDGWTCATEHAASLNALTGERNG